MDMENLKPHEVELVGDWILNGKQLDKDPVCERIHWLIEHSLKSLALSKDGWKILLIDPNDKRYWERSYPQGGPKGCGPPTISHVTEEYARKNYEWED